MAFWENMPYTNFHGENQDWIIKTMKKLIDEWAAYGDNLQRLYDQFTAEIKALIDAGKCFKIICDADLASAISANEGDIYVSFEYDLDGSDLLNLDFARTSTPLFTLSSGAFKTLPFSVEEGDLLQVIL
ncbi:MAG: hypothetical protein IIY21_00570 [Clostridiales bacterium]|nr:hypothetical protein [Clostridiales bacterium]